MKPLSVIFLTLALSMSSFAHQKVQSVDDILQCYVVEGRLVCETTRQPVERKKPGKGRFGHKEIITAPPESNDEMIMKMMSVYSRTPARVRQSLMGR
jgi:hypothetical protein